MNNSISPETKHENLPKSCTQLIDWMYPDGMMIPFEWYQFLRNEKGKTNQDAITILGDAVYWYRPTPIRDNRTAKIIGYAKKFASDKLQRDYAYYTEVFGISYKQARNAVQFLCDRNLLSKEVRVTKVKNKNGEFTMTNKLFIDINVPNIKALSDAPGGICYPEKDEQMPYRAADPVESSCPIGQHTCSNTCIKDSSEDELSESSPEVFSNPDGFGSDSETKNFPFPFNPDVTYTQWDAENGYVYIEQGNGEFEKFGVKYATGKGLKIIQDDGKLRQLTLSAKSCPDIYYKNGGDFLARVVIGDKPIKETDLPEEAIPFWEALKDHIVKGNPIKPSGQMMAEIKQAALDMAKSISITDLDNYFAYREFMNARKSDVAYHIPADLKAIRSHWKKAQTWSPDQSSTTKKFEGTYVNGMTTSDVAEAAKRMTAELEARNGR